MHFENKHVYTVLSFHMVKGGEISVKDNLDYETLRTQNKIRYDVTITADDGRESSAPQQLTLLITDVNEQQTGFVKALYTIETGEGQVPV